jgi:hypothetical protein
VSWRLATLAFGGAVATIALTDTFGPVWAIVPAVLAIMSVVFDLRLGLRGRTVVLRALATLLVWFVALFPALVLVLLFVAVAFGETP